MKRVFSIITILLSTILYSQEFKFEEVVIVDSTTTKEELFNRARSWFGKTYNNEKYVITTEDKNSGEISGNGSMNYRSNRMYFGVAAVEGDIDYKINIYVKDGRYKYIIHSFRHSGTSIGIYAPISYGILTNSSDAPKPSRGGANNKAWNDIKDVATNKIKKIVQGLKEDMNKQYESSKDW